MKIQRDRGRHLSRMDEASGGASRRRGPWRPGEDEALRHLVEQYGPQNWTSIAEKLQGRSAKSCRFRWFTHLEPTLNRRPFSEEEESILNPGVRKEIKDLFPVLPQQMAAASSAFPASEITGTSMGKIPRDFLSLGINQCCYGVTTMNELSSYGENGESSAGLQNVGVINSHSEEAEETEESCTMHNVGFIDFLGVGPVGK
ncbi:Transcription factor [Nymphaea thermarum]|nr:Transcription factor [Nymphaea thermarum]